MIDKMEEELDADLHICLNCHKTVIGLDLYVNHKKYECQAIKSKTKLFSNNSNVERLTNLHGCGENSNHIEKQVGIASSLKDIHRPFSDKAGLIMYTNDVTTNLIDVSAGISSSTSDSLCYADLSCHLLTPSKHSTDAIKNANFKTVKTSLNNDVELNSLGDDISTSNNSGNNKIIGEIQMSNKKHGEKLTAEHAGIATQKHTSDCENSNTAIATTFAPTTSAVNEPPDESVPPMTDAAFVAEFFSSLELRMIEKNTFDKVNQNALHTTVNMVNNQPTNEAAPGPSSDTLANKHFESYNSCKPVSEEIAVDETHPEIAERSVIEFFNSLELKMREPHSTDTTETNSHMSVHVSPRTDAVLNLIQDQNTEMGTVSQGKEMRCSQPFVEDLCSSGSITTTSTISSTIGSRVLCAPGNVTHKSANLLQPGKTNAFEERLKNIKIANILPDVDISSDSEDFPSDVDELLNFTDDEMEYRSLGGKWKPQQPPYEHTKGKWKPAGGKLLSYGKHGGKKDGHVSGKWKPGTMPISTYNEKWKSGQRVSHGQGKHGKVCAYSKQKLRGLTDSEDEREKVKTQEEKSGRKWLSNRTRSKKSLSPIKEKKDNYCDSCNKLYKSSSGLQIHMTSLFHKRKASSIIDNNKSVSDSKKHISVESSSLTGPFQCLFCGKSITNKYNYARHLANEHEVNSEQCLQSNGKSLDSHMQSLVKSYQPFQCKICEYYCEASKTFTLHLLSEDHMHKCQNLLGQLMCKRCKFQTDSNDDLCAHFNSLSHKKNLINSNRACVVKECRINIKCKNCSGIFSSLATLSKHTKAMHSGRVGRQRTVVNRPCCSYCGLQSQSQAQLAIHVRRKHTHHKPFSCQICQCSFASNSDLLRHNTTDKHLNNAVLKGCNPQAQGASEGSTALKKTGESEAVDQEPVAHCKYADCSYTDPNAKKLKFHYREKHGASKRFVCKLCNYTVSHKSHWESHCKTKKHLNLVEAEARAKHSQNSNCANTNKDTNLACDQCPLIFTDLKLLQKHQISHVLTKEKEKIIALKKMVDSDDLKYLDSKYHEFVNKLPQQKEASVTCPESHCLKMCKRKDIVSHLRSHTDVRPFTCVYCQKKFHRGETLKCHLLLHLPNISHPCNYCSQTFKRRTSLRHHMVNQHPQFPAEYQRTTQILSCTICNYKCTTTSKLTHHKLSHIRHDQRRFRCPWQGCAKTFSYKGYLVVHMNKHTQNHKYVCSQCGFSTLNSQNLNRHKMRHTGIRKYKCEYCTFSCYSSTGLNRHMRLHINTKPFRCPYWHWCDFKTNSLEHIRKHVNDNKKHVAKQEWLYPCLCCSSGFKSQVELKEHLSGEHEKKVELVDICLTALHPSIKSDTADWKSIPPGQKVYPIGEKYRAKKWRQDS